MASSIVRGCPDECLSVLVDLSSNTTILGPASRIELLEDGEERQVGRGLCQTILQPQVLGNTTSVQASGERLISAAMKRPPQMHACFLL